MGEPTYRAGIVGCGSIADTLEDELLEVPGYLLFPYSHATTYRRHPRTELVAAADPDPERLERFRRRWGIERGYPDAASMLAAEDLDLVSIASPTRTHHDVLLEALAAGAKGVFLEKPVARTLRDADEMIEAAHAAGTPVVVNHFRTFDPSFRAAAKLVHDGRIGRPTAVMATWGEGLSQGGCHLLDLLRSTLRAPVERVVCELDKDPSLPDPGGDFDLTLAGGIRVHVHMPFDVVAPPQVEFLGTEGMIRMGNFERAWWRFEKVSGRTVPVQWPFPGRSDGRSAMLTALDELLAAIEHGAPLSSTLADGRSALETTAALLVSGRSGTPVTLPFTDRDLLVDAWL